MQQIDGLLGFFVVEDEVYGDLCVVWVDGEVVDGYVFVFVEE